MFKLQVGAGAIAATTLITLIQGCGALPAKLPQSSVTEVRTDAQKLGPLIRKGQAEDREVPSTRSEDIIGAEPGFWIKSEHELAFRKTLILSPETNLFLTWEESALGAPIVGATYSWRSMSGKDNKPSRPLLSQPVPQEAATGRYFLNLRTVFGGASADLSAQDTQIIDVTLRLADEQASKKVFTFLLHVEGELPMPLIESVDPQDWKPVVSDHYGVEEWTVAQDQVTNPSSRTLRLWLKYEDEAPIEKRMLFARPTYGTAPSGAPTVGPVERLVQVAHYRVRKVRIKRGPNEETLQLQPGQWIDVLFKPHEQLSILWRASPEKGMAQCSLPEPRVQSFHWAGTCTPPPGNPAPGAVIGGILAGPIGAVIGGAISSQPGTCTATPEGTTLTTAFSMAGVEVSGQGTRQISVARDGVEVKLESEEWSLPQGVMTSLTPVSSAAGASVDRDEAASSCLGEL